MPLRPVEFHILVALAAEERHGYAIMQEAARLTGGELRLEPGTLYRALHRMLKDGWVAECERRPVPRTAHPGDRGPRSEHDDRRRYYRLTPLGRRVASAEAERLSRLVAAARAGRLLTRA
ncbi:MAG: helix-turn-helix transcriptional regulator [Acidobacteriia bacterium]|nr:helix-turn-helix transcriptional regulator [Terriglobia bacterium]